MPRVFCDPIGRLIECQDLHQRCARGKGHQDAEDPDAEGGKRAIPAEGKERPDTERELNKKLANDKEGVPGG